MNTTATTLKAARDLIAKPENWTQGEYARRPNGTGTIPLDADAMCFCSVGALAKVIMVNPASDYIHKQLIASLGFKHEAGLILFNDRSTHSEVLALFSKAISSAEEKQVEAS